MGWLDQMRLCQLADADSKGRSLSGWLQYCRRAYKRGWLDRATINAPRVFCQNSGGCGSSYVVRLLIDNGVSRAFHERTPDLNQIGVAHFDQPFGIRNLIRILRYTRHDVDFEANNRLFSLTREIAAAFPNARFIHLHRNGADAVRSAMSKPDVPNYLRTNLRFQGTLAGPHAASVFARCCHYWNNMNKRIADDLDSMQVNFLSLKFEDMVGGRVDALEEFLNLKFQKRSIPKVNEGRVRTEGKFAIFGEWSDDEKAVFESICGTTMQRLGYRAVI